MSESATPWTVAHQSPLSVGFSGKNTEAVAISHSRWSFWPTDWTLGHSWVSCIGRWILYHWATREACLRSIEWEFWGWNQWSVFQQAFQVILMSQKNLCFIFQGAAQALPQPPPALGHHLLQLLLIFYLHPVLPQRFIWPPTLSTWAAERASCVI